MHYFVIYYLLDNFLCQHISITFCTIMFYYIYLINTLLVDFWTIFIFSLTLWKLSLYRYFYTCVNIFHRMNFELWSGYFKELIIFLVKIYYQSVFQMDTPIYTQMTNYDRACYSTFLTTLGIIYLFSVITVWDGCINR